MDTGIHRPSGPAEDSKDDGPDDNIGPGSAEATTLAGTEREGSPKHDGATGNGNVVDTLLRLMYSKNLSMFFELGGIEGLGETLRTNTSSGLGADSHADLFTIDEYQASVTREKLFGTNHVSQAKGCPFLWLLLDGLTDAAIVIYLVANILALILPLSIPSLRAGDDGFWVSAPVALPLVLLGVILAAVIRYNSEQEKALLTEKIEDRLVRATRSGQNVRISVYDVLVGDILHLEPGEIVPADGILIKGFNLTCDEACITGESEHVAKAAVGSTLERSSGLDPFIISGSKIIDGRGTYMVIAVGNNSTEGQTKLASQEQKDETPVLSRYGPYVKFLSWCGLVVAAVYFIKQLVVIRRLAIRNKRDRILETLNSAITIFMVAVPDGLPLSVVLTYWSTVKRLADRKIHIRDLSAFKPLSEISAICCDKTGTLTTNEMTVRACIFDNVFRSLSRGVAPRIKAPGQSPLPYSGTFVYHPKIKQLLLDSLAINSTAFETDGTLVGSKTEAALLVFARDHLGMKSLAAQRESAEIVECFPFSPRTKCMATVVKLTNWKIYRMFIKGAPEVILNGCSSCLDPYGAQQIPFGSSTRQDLLETTDEYGMQSWRSLAVAYRDFPDWPPIHLDLRLDIEQRVQALCQDLVFLGLFGLEDPLRPGVKDAVEACHDAGIPVIMVTGDGMNTAEAVAKESGILDHNGIVMAGSDFRALSRYERHQILPRLRVLARVTPTDKKLLVKDLQEAGHVVGVTGDGSNDGPALRAADVGFAMGKTGTEIAKAAASVVLMDDDFSSIVVAINWAQSVQDGIEKYMTYQATTTLSIVPIMAFSQPYPVFTSLDLVYVNLIMETVAALALATDAPDSNRLRRRSERRNSDALLSRSSVKNMIVSATFMVCVTLGQWYRRGGYDIPLGEKGDKRLAKVRAAVNTTFMCMLCLNLLVNRRLGNKCNLLNGVTRNWAFIFAMIAIPTGHIAKLFFSGTIPSTDACMHALLFSLAGLVLALVMRRVAIENARIWRDVMPCYWIRRQPICDVERQALLEGVDDRACYSHM
ncbi:PMCA-type calcium-translocating P-type ATPase [Echria macrotheca]|uniref:PMCA-type calcium-translocating P-type ATPase n=1 Tax=Echria macrotheca TaxID=438768 RepID=A0AAJ0BGM6_9PEZI|nr:PMCA-type calcium-translocating P-type ATPase [Echria macrotheca]